MGSYVKFTKTTHVTLASNSENFYISPNSILTFRRSYKIWGKLVQEQKVTGKKQIRGVENTPSAYRVKTLKYFWQALKYFCCVSCIPVPDY